MLSSGVYDFDESSDKTCAVGNVDAVAERNARMSMACNVAACMMVGYWCFECRWERSGWLYGNDKGAPAV